MRLAIPEPSLVLLVGPSGAGKSTFAAAQFRPTEVVSSDELRARVADDPNDQDASADAFRILALIVNGRLRRRLTAVVDATNVRPRNRRRLAALAARYGMPVVAIVFNFADEDFVANNSRRTGRRVEESVVREQVALLRAGLAALPAEGYAGLYMLRSPAEATEAIIERG